MTEENKIEQDEQLPVEEFDPFLDVGTKESFYVPFHTHDGVDSPKLKYEDILNVLDVSNFVNLTTAQTIAGVKTFSSIPVLPASDPTTDNQAARKAYVDAQVYTTEIIASDNLRDSADTERTHDTTTYTKYKEITVNEVDGVVRVKFDGKQANNSGNSYLRIYVNGVAVGTEREATDSTYITYSEDITVESGDNVQLYMKLGSHVVDVYVRNFRLYYDKVFSVTAGTIVEN